MIFVHRANAVSALHGKVAREMWHHLWPEHAVEEVPIRQLRRRTSCFMLGRRTSAIAQRLVCITFCSCCAVYNNGSTAPSESAHRRASANMASQSKRSVSTAVMGIPLISRKPTLARWPPPPLRGSVMLAPILCVQYEPRMNQIRAVCARAQNKRLHAHSLAGAMFACLCVGE